MEKVYDVAILGGGPAGLTAALYAGRARLDTLLIEKAQTGGQIAMTDEIENYPGQLVEGESGSALVARMVRQTEKFGAERCDDVITGAELSGDVKKLVGGKGEYLAKTVIVCTGAHPKPIGCENEGKFIGSGISYCATCDAAFFEGLEVFVVGGGDSAVEEALYLAKFARRVTIIHRRSELRAAKSIQEKAFANPKIGFLWDSVVTKADGDEVLSRLTVRNIKTGELTLLTADENDGLFGLFGFVGSAPNSGLFEGILELDNGYIKTDENMRTEIPGVFAAGDIRAKSLRQVVTAAADGAIAAVQAEKYINA